MQKAPKRGFSLIELMVVVGITGVLASIAIPAFQKYSLRAKLAEAPIHIESITNLEAAFYTRPRTNAAGKDIPPCFLSFADPVEPTLTRKHAFTKSVNSEALGFNPAGSVYLAYYATALADGGFAICGTPTDTPDPALKAGAQAYAYTYRYPVSDECPIPPAYYFIRSLFTTNERGLTTLPLRSLETADECNPTQY